MPKKKCWVSSTSQHKVWLKANVKGRMASCNPITPCKLLMRMFIQRNDSRVLFSVYVASDALRLRCCSKVPSTRKPLCNTMQNVFCQRGLSISSTELGLSRVSSELVQLLPQRAERLKAGEPNCVLLFSSGVVEWSLSSKDRANQKVRSDVPHCCDSSMPGSALNPVQ